MSARYRFGSYELDVDGRQVSREGEMLSLTPKAFDLLLTLAENRGRAMSRDDLVRALWSEAFVEEANLSFQISALRRALGEEGAKYIETVPKHGYRFTCPLIPADSPKTKPRPESVRFSRRIVIAVAAGLALIGVVGAITWLSLHRPSEWTGRQEVSVLPLTSYPGYEIQPSLSPDGSQVAFSWNGPNEDNYDVYVKLVGQGEPVRLTTNPAPDVHPAWSPDGQYIAFLRHSSERMASLFLIPALGGAERKLADVETLVFRPRGGGRNLSWSADSKYLTLARATDPNGRSSIWAIAVDTGEWRRLTTAPSGFDDYSPVVSGDDRSIAFIRGTRPNLADVYIQRLSEAFTAVGEPRRVTFDVGMIQALAWLPNQSRLLYSIGRPFGLAQLRMIDVRGQSDSRGRKTVALPFGEGVSALSVSPAGRLVYARRFGTPTLWKVQVSGEETSTPTRLKASSFDDHGPDYSPDGKRLAFASTRSGFEEIWTAEADGSRPSQLTNLRAPQTANPRWAADGTKILFNSFDQKQSDLWTVTVSDGTLKRVTNDPENEVEPRWSRDGKWIYYSSGKGERYDIYKMPAEGGSGMPVTRGGGINPNESRDGRLLYYAKTPFSPSEIWRVPVSGGKEEKVLDGLSYSLNFVVGDKGIYFLSVGDRETETALEFYEFKTGKRKQLRAVGKTWSYGMAISPRQDSICYSIVDQAGSSLIVVDGMK